MPAQTMPMPDLAGAGDAEHEGVAVRAAGRAELIAGDDRRRVAGQRRRIGREVAQQRGDEGAGGAPQRQADEKADAVLREARGQHDDRDRAHHGADHAEPALAQRGAEVRLADDRRRGAGPVRVVELEPERDVKGKADRGPQAQAEQQRRARGPQRVDQRRAPRVSCPPYSRAVHRRHLQGPLSRPVSSVFRRIDLRGDCKQEIKRAISGTAQTTKV